MARNARRSNDTNGTNNGDTNRITRRRVSRVIAGIAVVAAIVVGVFAHYGKLHLPGKTHTPAYISAEDNSAPMCDDVISKMIAPLKKAALQNGKDQPVLTDNLKRLAPQYTCIVKDADGAVYTIGISKEKSGSHVLFDHIIAEYTSGSSTSVNAPKGPKLTVHAYSAVRHYDAKNNGLTKSQIPIFQADTSKSFIYGIGTLRGGALKCNNIIVAVVVNDNISIDVLNRMFAAALKEPAFAGCK